MREAVRHASARAAGSAERDFRAAGGGFTAARDGFTGARGRLPCQVLHGGPTEGVEERPPVWKHRNMPRRTWKHRNIWLLQIIRGRLEVSSDKMV
eukprot:5952280-Pyramimonas_sp.AAC.1